MRAPGKHRTILLALLALGPACSPDLPTLGEILGQFEAGAAVPFESCAGGFVDCGATSATSLEHKAARACLLDAWQACRPTRFTDQAVESSDSVLLRYIYIAPGRAGCDITVFEHRLLASARKTPTLDHLECEAVVADDACGGFALQGCSLVETIAFAYEQWSE